MFFQDVSPGESRFPEPAARYNAVNRLLCKEDEYASGYEFPAFSGGVVDFCNTSGEVIKPFTAVSVTGCRDNFYPQVLGGRFSGSCIVNGIPAKDDSMLWGVSLDEVAEYEYGRLQISGVVPAWFSGSGKRVTPGKDGLIAGASGIGEVVVSPINDGEYREDSYPGIIVLRGSAATADYYGGAFKLQAVSQTVVKVINGIYPDSESCGTSDVPGLFNVPQMTLEISPGMTHTIWLYFDFDTGSKTYSAHLSAQLPENILLYRHLGYFADGNVTQSYRSYDMLRFGDDFYLYAGDT